MGRSVGKTPYLRKRNQIWFLRIKKPRHLWRDPNKPDVHEESSGLESLREAKAWRNGRIAELQDQWAPKREAMASTAAFTEGDYKALLRSEVMQGQFDNRIAAPWADGSIDFSSPELRTKMLAVLKESVTQPGKDVDAALNHFLDAHVIPTMRQGVTGAERLFESGQRPQAPAKATPLTQYQEQWLKAPSSSRKNRFKADRTQDECKYAIKTLADYLIKQKSPVTIEAVTPLIAIAFAEYLEKVKKSPVTANKLISLVRSYWRYLAKPLHVIEKNPWEKIRLAVPDKEPEEERRPFTPDEQVKLFDHLEKRGKTHLLNLCAFALLTGARYGDLMKLNASDERDGCLHMLGQKKGRRYWTPMHYLLLPIYTKLKASKGDSEPLLKAPPAIKRKSMSGKLNQAQLNKRFNYLKAKLFNDDPTINFHTWGRHTLATLLENSGCPEVTINRILGHRPGDSASVKHYAKGELDYMREQLNKIKLDPRVVAVLERLSR